LVLSLKTAAASTVLCVLLGVPMALVLARNDGRVVQLVRPLLLLPLVLPPVVGGIALLYAFGRLGLIGQYLRPRASDRTSRQLRWCWRRRSRDPVLWLSRSKGSAHRRP
jgi:ABC-type molybdate transport system permease subunit